MIDWLIYCLLLNVLRQIFHAHSIQENRIGGVMVSMLTSSAVDRGFERFVLDQHAELDFYSASSLKQHSAGRHVSPLEHSERQPGQWL
jgi:hypothetical protein